MPRPVRILIVDDSALIRAHLKQQLSTVDGVEIVGLAPDPYVAREILLKESPDMVLLDIEMPRMDGLTFLRKIMKFKPTPTLVISSVTPKGSGTALACLEAGALDVLCKPSSAYSIEELQDQIVRWIEEVARQGSERLARRQASIAEIPETPASSSGIATTNRLVAIGASAGGPETLRQLLAALPRSAPGIAIVQHMGPAFLAQMAERLNAESKIEVKLAENGDAVIPGRALLAPGDKHMEIVRNGARYEAKLTDGPLVKGHRPAVDVMFQSVAKCAAANALGIVLTGMGDDGADGLLAMRNAGSRTVAQDEATSIVFGMPARAIEAGAADQVLPLDEIPRRIAHFNDAPQSRAAG